MQRISHVHHSHSELILGDMGAGTVGQGGQAPTLEKITVGNAHSGNTNHNRKLDIAH